MAPAAYEYNGKIYNFCCPGCIATFKADPEKYGKVAEDEVAAAQVK
ncbi:MAG: YHS domain-containing protein [Candidatus Omnitrophica bacterium]|nr:YHS domain-containing protein [Candidatus Omnitrophota bacterium]